LAELFENDPPPASPSPPAKAASGKKAKATKTRSKKKAKTKAKAPKTKKAKAKAPKTKKAKARAPKTKKPKTAKAGKTTPSLDKRIEQACLKLTQGARQTRVTLRDLRAELWDVAREDLDGALLALQREKKLVLYREDNSAALRPEDHQAALFVGNEPRHLVLLEA
jgi:hypothetical protein